jgi:hypothetical protein
VSAPLLTLPKEGSASPRYLTGNEYLSFPKILPRTGGIASLNVLSMALCGLLEFVATLNAPLLEPFWEIDGKERGLKKISRWRYREHWEPNFCCYQDGCRIQGALSCPPGERGAVYLLSVKNTGASELRVRLGWRGAWRAVQRTIFTRKALDVRRRVFFDQWTKSLILEAGSDVPLAALALSTPGEGKWDTVYQKKRSLYRYRTAAFFRLFPGEKCCLPLYMAVNLDGDGAGTTLVDLKRQGWRKLVLQSRRWLRERLRTVEDVRLNKIMNRNLFFNYFFAQGLTLDTDRRVAVTSRSPHYYVSAAFWSRDTLLWSLPGLLLTDPQVAREVLLLVYDHHLSRAGEHAHYLNGVLLYPGFELDQLAAYLLALRNYLNFTGDVSILSEKSIGDGLKILVRKLISRRDPRSGLYSTFLDPSDDPVRYPFLIYNNALVCCALRFLAGLKQNNFLEDSREDVAKKGPDLAALAEDLQRAIHKQGVVKGPLGEMFAWSVDGEGNFELYDNPPGSLQLLAYYGFCTEEEQVFRNTLNWIRSSHNPYFHLNSPLQEAGSRHAGNPWPLAAANDLLSQNRGAFNFLRRAAMDNGFVCETVNPVDGRASTGFAFASAAGFLAAAIWRRYGTEKTARAASPGYNVL